MSDLSIPGISTTVASAHVELYREVLAHPECPALPRITLATFETPIRNKPLKTFAETLLAGRKASVWTKGLYAVAFADAQNAPVLNLAGSRGE